ncbi:MAG TPA: succinate dehydrogenase assembly factor 2 [Thiobacillaceae bacterium]|nr:succinate dehydrogenase assembly factor 2 [Thiobacillaceae bacterium]HNA83199.1 succinate dehydrogenase assembly factor 2 [Thiobacillaceae bacterium]HNF90375.1 succinate dehydrogenase assembly factor 2 [Thiobacillaceae bacterium]HNI09322.1 succinate dehydrogenase assembly factor 2 [Thiobacillaceae bacterium]
MPNTLPNLSRLSWLCRRGMLELDAWLTLFLDTRYSDLSPQRQGAFARLLDQDDMALYDWLTGEQAPPDDFSDVVALIRSTRYPRP